LWVDSLPDSYTDGQKNRLSAAEFFWINANWVRFRSTNDNGVYNMINGRLFFKISELHCVSRI